MNKSKIALSILAIVGIGVLAYAQFQPVKSNLTSATRESSAPINQQPTKVGNINNNISNSQTTLKVESITAPTIPPVVQVSPIDVPPEKRIKAKLSAIEHNAPTDDRSEQQPRPHGYEHTHTHGDNHSARPPGEPKKPPPNQVNNP